MPVIQLRIDGATHTALKTAANRHGLTMAAWARMTLIERLAAAMPAQHAESSAPKKPGPKPQSDEDWLAPFLSDLPPFPSGQRRFRHVQERYPEMADDERAHAEAEADYLAQKGAKLIYSRPRLHAYYMEHYVGRS